MALSLLQAESRVRRITGSKDLQKLKRALKNAFLDQESRWTKEPLPSTYQLGIHLRRKKATKQATPSYLLPMVSSMCILSILTNL